MFYNFFSTYDMLSRYQTQKYICGELNQYKKKIRFENIFIRAESTLIHVAVSFSDSLDQQKSSNIFVPLVFRYYSPNV